MTEFFFEYGLFAAKLATFVFAILIVVGVSIGATRRVKRSMKGHIETTRINDEIDAMRDALDAGVSDPEIFKQHIKQKGKQQKLERKARKKALKKAPLDAAADAKANHQGDRFFGNLKPRFGAVLGLERHHDSGRRRDRQQQ